MSFKYQSLAKPILIFSLLIGLSSAYLGNTWTQSAKIAKSSVANVNKEVRTTKEALKNIEENLTEGDSAQPLETLVPSVILDIYNQRVAYGITLGKVMSTKSGGALKPSVDEMADAVPGSSLKSFGIRLSGTYKTYPELQEYLKLMTKKAVAITKLDVTEQSFDVLLTVYGTSSNEQ